MISYVKARKIDGDGSSGAFVMGLGLKVRREGEIDDSESRGELRGGCVSKSSRVGVTVGQGGSDIKRVKYIIRRVVIVMLTGWCRGLRGSSEAYGRVC